MYVEFRQGIIKAPTQFLMYYQDNIRINTTDSDISITVSHGTSEYLISEPKRNSTLIAWVGPFNALVENWLFWDIDTKSTQLSYVSTTIPPLYQSSSPLLPVANTHWFNTSDNIMRVWNGTSWIEKIRVYAGKLSNNILLELAPVGSSQSGNNSPYNSGVILYNTNKLPIRKSLSAFLTTADTLLYDNENLSATNIEAKTIWAQVTENVNAYSIVATLSDGTLKLANASDVGVSNLGIAMDNAILGNHVSVVLQGKITNLAWNWSTINQLLWVSISGQLVDYNPNTLNSSLPNKSPVARVLSSDSIIFMPGLVEPVLSTPQSTILPIATDTISGISKLATPATNPLIPIVVGTNDPRLIDARTPLTHTHTAQTTTTSTYNFQTASNVQDTLNSLYDNKLNVVGGTMTGSLYLNGLPTTALEAANKQYVDNAITGLEFKESVTVATITNIPILSGLLIIDAVQLIAGDRVLVKNQTNETLNGIYRAQSGTWTRTTDADENTEVKTGIYVFVDNGTTNSQTGWILTTSNPIIGTSLLTFVQFNGLGQLTASYGVVKTGNNVSVNTVSNSRIIATLSGIDLAATSVVPGTYNNITVDNYGRAVSGSNTTYLTDNNVVFYTGDVNGAGNAIVDLTLASVSVPGTYSIVTIDDKGRVLFGDNPLSGVIPGTYNNVTVNDVGIVTDGSNSLYITGNETITLTGDVVGNGTTSINTTLANNGVTPGTYKTVTVDGTGRVTAGDVGLSGITPGIYNNLTVNSYGIATSGSNTAYLTQLSLNQLTDVVVPTPSLGDVVKWDGTQWINSPDIAGGGAGVTTLDQLTDVSTPTPVLNDYLKWNGTQWVNSTVIIPPAELDPIVIINLMGDDLIDAPILSPGTGGFASITGGKLTFAVSDLTMFNLISATQPTVSLNVTVNGTLTVVNFDTATMITYQDVVNRLNIVLTGQAITTYTLGLDANLNISSNITITSILTGSNTSVSIIDPVFPDGLLGRLRQTAINGLDVDARASVGGINSTHHTYVDEYYIVGNLPANIPATMPEMPWVLGTPLTSSTLLEWSSPMIFSFIYNINSTTTNMVDIDPSIVTTVGQFKTFIETNTPLLVNIDTINGVIIITTPNNTPFTTNSVPSLALIGSGNWFGMSGGSYGTGFGTKTIFQPGVWAAAGLSLGDLVVYDTAGKWKRVGAASAILQGKRVGIAMRPQSGRLASGTFAGKDGQIATYTA